MACGTTKRESIGYVALTPDDSAEQIVHAISQPWGVSFGDITVHAGGDGYIL